MAATDAFEQALKLDPNNAQAKSGLTAVQRAVEAEAKADGLSGDPSGGLGNLFNDPGMYQKLAANPKTSSLLGDQEFMNKLKGLQSNPNAVGEALQDPRMLQVMSVLLGIDMQMGGPPGGAGEGGKATEAEEDMPMPDAKPSRSQPEPEKEPEPEDEETKAQREAKAKADEEKKLGTENYKKRQFDAAIEHYNKAWELHKDITYLTNLGAAKYEKGDYQGAIDACQQAVDHGREVLADFKLIAKAFGRMGSAYEKLGDYANAVEYYNRSLTEHRTPDILAKLRAAEKTKIKADRESYIDPVKAEEARELGNAKFKESDWPAAVEAYTEMIKRAPDDPRGYSNRAASLIKLLTFPSAVSDCEEAIKRDPNFTRAYIRKAQAYFGMRQYNKCIDACAEATAHDPEGKNAREIQAQEQKAINAQYSAREGETEEQTMARIQQDPEVSSQPYFRDNPANFESDCKHSPGPCDVEHLAASQGQSCRATGSHEESSDSFKCPKVGRCRRDSPRAVNGAYFAATDANCMICMIYELHGKDGLQLM